MTVGSSRTAIVIVVEVLPAGPVAVKVTLIGGQNCVVGVPETVQLAATLSPAGRLLEAEQAWMSPDRNVGLTTLNESFSNPMIVSS